MEIHSQSLGRIEYQKENVFHFPDGLPGFPEEKEFIVISLEYDSPLQFMQSIKKEDLTFVIVNPFLFFQDYDFEIPSYVLQKLQIEKVEEVQIWNIVTVKEPFQDSTVNLQAPIVMNKTNNQAKQALLSETSYSRRQPLFSGTEGASDSSLAEGRVE